MSDSYQAVHDAVRSRISGGNIGEVIESVAREAFDISWQKDAIKTEFLTVAFEMQRPSVVFKPTISQDGNAWLAILGDLPTGVVGSGDTPAEAMLAFDKAWHAKAHPPLTPSLDPATVEACAKVAVALCNLRACVRRTT